MKIKEFKKITKEKIPRDIIALHTHNKIYLTDKQIDKLLELRGENYWKYFKKEGFRNGKNNTNKK